MSVEFPEIERRLRAAFEASQSTFGGTYDDVQYPRRPSTSRAQRRVGPLLAAGIVVAIAAVIAAAALGGSGHRRVTGAASSGPNSITSTPAVSASSAAPPPAASPVIIDSESNEVFAPAPASVVPPLSADAAYQVEAKLSGSSRVSPPGFVRVQLGYLTIPVGPCCPDLIHHKLVWAFSWHECPISTNPLNPTPAPSPCVAWKFLDASNGSEIDMTWQH